MKKRINKITGKPYKQGDKREDGYVFKNYIYAKEKDGFYLENWMSPEVAFKWRMYLVMRTTKTKRRRGESTKKLTNNLDIDYLISIYPKNSKCPVLGIELKWGSETNKSLHKDNSPSLDRINPNLGYIKGNVHFVSNRFNRMKSDREIDDLVKLGSWAEKFLEEGIESARLFTVK